MRSRLHQLVAVSLLWLALSPQPLSLRDTPPILDYGTRPVDWSILRERLDEQSRFYTWASQPPPPTTPATVGPLGAPSASRGNHRGYATARERVSMRENGGSYTESSNPTHKGRYQFSRPLWISFGGVAEHWDDWSLTSPGEQDAVFERAWSSPGGPSNWLPYDGC